MCVAVDRVGIGLGHAGRLGHRLARNVHRGFPLSGLDPIGGHGRERCEREKAEASEPGVRGDTANNVTKVAKVETGAEVAVPLFVNIGEKIKVDTRTHEYVERVK